MRILSALMLSAALAASAAAPGFAEGAARLITVTGEGVQQAAPDMATVSLGVTTQGDTAASAMAANTAAMSKVMDRLRAAGIEDRDLQTTGLSINPNWQNDETTQQMKIIGYVASNQLTIRVRVLPSLGAVLDAAITDGANTLNGVSFSLADPAPAMNEARKAAVADAIARATLLVEAAGAKLGPVVSITEGGAMAQPGPMPMFRMDAAAAPVPVAGGEVGITASVSVVFEISDK